MIFLKPFKISKIEVASPRWRKRPRLCLSSKSAVKKKQRFLNIGSADGYE